MSKYIDAEKLKKSIGDYAEGAQAALNPIDGDADYYKGKIDACKDIQEFIASLHQEQPEVDLDLDREIIKYKVPFTDESEYLNETTLDAIARHFYGLRNRALEEAARHVYESWMGGTMDDVRRDMVKLCKVIKARNKE